jgi:hypothetical protein
MSELNDYGTLKQNLGGHRLHSNEEEEVAVRKWLGKRQLGL